MDAIDLNSRRDDNDWDTNVNGRVSSKDARDCDPQRDTTLAENHRSALSNGNFSNPLSSVPELPSSSPSSRAAAGPSSSKLDKATAVARAALRNRFAELGDTTGDTKGETTPLLISNIWGPSSNSNKKEVNGSKLPLNSLDDITRPFTCPGCLMDFKSISGFVLHIENRSCMSSLCHEIEDQLKACVNQFLNTLSSKWQARHEGS